MKMSLRDKRTGRSLVRTRRLQPDFVRKAGPHKTDQHYFPNVCHSCHGKDYSNCPTCDGTGQL